MIIFIFPKFKHEIQQLVKSLLIDSFRWLLLHLSRKHYCFFGQLILEEFAIHCCGDQSVNLSTIVGLVDYTYICADLVFVWLEVIDAVIVFCSARWQLI